MGKLTWDDELEMKAKQGCVPAADLGRAKNRRTYGTGQVQGSLCSVIRHRSLNGSLNGSALWNAGGLTSSWTCG